ncbi:di-heme oxidoredictase family protein [Halioxenophilus aromaticivorans]|uniref:Di-heme oxidoredictase family protein n=2 Tax=Halioxenophilus aromaticivorans TaxID=1306992 RepID=A0AAV3U3W1_9ALTE
MLSASVKLVVAFAAGRGDPGLLHFVRLLLSLVASFCLVACQPKGDSNARPAPPFSVAELKPGGSASVSTRPFASLMLPSANLPQSARSQFHAGKALAHQPWVKAPTVTNARDGLGPIFNARTCLACHINGGRGDLPADASRPIFAALVRLSIPGVQREYGAVPEPTYGLQLQGQSISLQHQFRHHPPAAKVREAAPESYTYIDWQAKTVAYADGETVTLRFPTLRFAELNYGPMSERVLTSLRAAPAIAGLGLIELIAQSDIDTLADPEDSNGDGISGRVNLVWDAHQKKVLPGRFGWKANRASLMTTVAAAFQQDVGISNPVFPSQPCTELQPDCTGMINGNNSEGFEIDQELLDLVVDFTRNLAVPEARLLQLGEERLQQGRQLFYQVGCADCHTPSFQTQSTTGYNSHLGGQIIWPYTDLLLHDLGPELADNRPDYHASGSEWRTPPLWAIGLSNQVNGNAVYLHDGRAQSVAEAILWHGGEAASSQKQFRHLVKSQRQLLIEFVESL